MNPSRCLYQCCWIACWILFLILSISIVTYARKSYSGFGYLLDNWKQSPFVSIYPTYDTCKQGEESLMQYLWPGSYPGCDCTNYEWRPSDLFVYHFLDDFQPERIMYSGEECNSTQIYYQCVTVSSTKKTLFDRFPDSTGKAMKLCGTRSGHPYILTTGQDCKSDETKCGNDDQFYCSSDKQCPISSFGFSKDAPKDSVSTKLDKEVFWTSNDPKNLPIVEIRVAEGDGVCMKNKERSITQGRTDYELMRTQKTDCDRDLRFKQFYSTNEKVYYEVNNQVIHIEKLSSFSVSDKIQWGVYSREYILWKNQCRPELMEEFIEFGYILSLINVITIIFLLICCLILLGACVIMIAMCTAWNNYPDWLDDDFSDNAKTLYKNEFVLKFSIHLFILCILVGITVPIKMAGKFMENIIECSDEMTNITLIGFKDSLQSKAGSINITFLIIYLIVFVLDLALALSYLVKLNNREPRDPIAYESIQQQ